MKIGTLVMALAAFSFMLTACGNQQANKKQNTENQTETVVEEQTKETPTFTADDVNQIGAIISVWEEMPIPVAAVEGMSDIKRVANAFCSAFSNYEPNKVICDYINNPDTESEYFMVENMEENGSIVCKAMSQFSKDMSCHIWDRKNGHKLVVFWLLETHEGDEETNLLAFYDFDPATNTMTPEPKLVNKIVESMNQYDSYGFDLPEDGQDAGLVGYKILEEDDYETTYYILRWNGNDFNLEKSEE